MIEDATIARPYARAVFELAQKEDQLAQWSAMLKALRLIAADQQIAPLIHHPKVSNAFLVQLIVAVCGDLLSKTGANFVRTLVAAGRLPIVGKIFEIFEDKCFAAAGTKKLHVTAAYKLTDSQIAMIAQTMAKRLNAAVNISSTVDEKLIGGIVIRFGDSVIDGSIKGRLQKLDNIFAN